MYKQLIIARKDLNMSPGKLAAQVSHGSMAFLTNLIRDNAHKIIEEKIGRAWEYCDKPQFYLHPDLNQFAETAREYGYKTFLYKPKDPSNPYGKQIMCNDVTVRKYHTDFDIDKETYEEWINGSFTKIVCQAKNRNQLIKAIKIAEELGLEKGKDFFPIKDNCLTELEPEEVDENGVGRTLTCIGFRPLPAEIAEQISKKFHLYI